MEWRVKNHCICEYFSGLYFNEKFSKYRSAASKFQMRLTFTVIHRQNGEVLNLLTYFPSEVNYRNWKWLSAKTTAEQKRYFANGGLLRCSVQLNVLSIQKKMCWQVWNIWAFERTLIGLEERRCDWIRCIAFDKKIVREPRRTSYVDKGRFHSRCNINVSENRMPWGMRGNMRQK